MAETYRRVKEIDSKRNTQENEMDIILAKYVNVKPTIVQQRYASQLKQNRPHHLKAISLDVGNSTKATEIKKQNRMTGRSRASVPQNAYFETHENKQDSSKHQNEGTPESMEHRFES